MPTTGTINTQQVIQMGTLTEKLQQTLQHLPVTTGQQLQDEQATVNEIKQTEVQDPEESAASNPTHPEGKRRRESRLRKKAAKENESENIHTGSTTDSSSKAVSPQGQHINLTV